MNELRPQIEPEFVEELIENDFIQLDEFIFKIWVLYKYFYILFYNKLLMVRCTK